MDTVYGTKKYFQSLGASDSDYYNRSSTNRAVVSRFSIFFLLLCFVVKCCFSFSFQPISLVIFSFALLPPKIMYLYHFFFFFVEVCFFLLLYLCLIFYLFCVYSAQHAYLHVSFFSSLDVCITQTINCGRICMR